MHMQRAPVNSDLLKTQHPEAYRNFFGRVHIAASCSHSFLWTGEFAGLYDGIVVSQKLPFRTYVGLEHTPSHPTSLAGEYTSYDPAEQSFTTRSLDQTLHANLLKYLVGVSTNSPTLKNVKVHILSEIPLGHSLGSNGALAAALALLIEHNSDINVVFQQARDILSAGQSGFSSGVTAYTALSKHHGPLVFQNHHDTFSVSALEDILDKPDALVWPIDFGLIYTGSQANVDSIILANDHTIHELEESSKHLQEILPETTMPNFKDAYMGVLNMTSGLMISALEELFTKGANNTRLERLFNTLNQYQNSLQMVDASNSTIDLLYMRIHALASKQKNDVGSGAKISGIGKGGMMLFALPFGTHRTQILELIETIREETGKNIWLDYASWMDGIGGEAGKIEQDISNKQFSSFIDRDALSIYILDQGVATEHVIATEHFDEATKHIDILLDKTTGKILIGGEAVTSKELPSQKSAISILADVIKSPKFSLSNGDITGTYGSNRYDLQGKIVIPLIKRVKQKTGRDLQLVVQGNMYDDYTLTLNPSNIVIGIIEHKS